MNTTTEQVKKNGKFQLGFQKASDPATGKQIKFLEKLITSKNVSTSQLMKRLEIDEASELIDLAKQGYEFEIVG